jgi:hypothetical protein
MKTLLIVIALCSVFIINSGMTPPGPKPVFNICPKSASTNPTLDRQSTRAVEKAKVGKLPRWHRVIPGMFS